MTTATLERPATAPLLRVRDLVTRLAMSPSAIYQLLDSGTLPSVKLPGSGSRFHRRVHPADLEVFINRHRIGNQHDDHDGSPRAA